VKTNVRRNYKFHDFKPLGKPLENPPGGPIGKPFATSFTPFGYRIPKFFKCLCLWLIICNFAILKSKGAKVFKNIYGIV